MAATPSRPRRPAPGGLAAWRALLESHARLFDRLDAELRTAHDLPLTWYEVLLCLSEAPDGCLRMRDLADASLLTRSSGTRVVDRMERAGLVERRPDPADARGVYAALTPAGRARLRQAALTHLRGVEEHFVRHLSEAEAASMAEALGRVTRALRE